MISEVMKVLKDKGYRITAQRQAIIEVVVASDKLLTAAEIWGLVRVRYSDVGLDTIYRNLNMLTDLGIMIPIESIGKDGVRYEIASACHHHHIVCIKCGHATCIDFCPVNQNFIAMLRGNGFELLRHSVEFFGVCSDCKAEEDQVCVK